MQSCSITFPLYLCCTPLFLQRTKYSMGNHQSNDSMYAPNDILQECKIDDDPIIRISNQWSLHHAQVSKPPGQMSVFISKEDKSSLEDFARVRFLSQIYFCSVSFHILLSESSALPPSQYSEVHQLYLQPTEGPLPIDWKSFTFECGAKAAVAHADLPRHTENCLCSRVPAWCGQSVPQQCDRVFGFRYPRRKLETSWYGEGREVS